MTALRSLFENIIFLSTVTSLCTSQLLKMVFYLFTNRNKKIMDAVQTMIWRTGGMPSSHSAIVCSLAASTAIREGISSNFFIFSLVFAMVVLRDSLGVRRAAGLQAKALNSLGKQSAEKTGLKFQSVKEIQGHSIIEVLVGALLGIAIAFLFCFLLKAFKNEEIFFSAGRASLQ
jgi:acid phosphatase family membrane protein YuiD